MTLAEAVVLKVLQQLKEAGHPADQNFVQEVFNAMTAGELLRRISEALEDAGVMK